MSGLGNKKGPHGNADRDNLQQPKCNRNPVPTSIVLARALLKVSFPNQQLQFFMGDFYCWRVHKHTGGHFAKIPRRALDPFIFVVLDAHGIRPTAGAVRQITLALSAITLVHTRPAPDFDQANMRAAGYGR